MGLGGWLPVSVAAHIAVAALGATARFRFEGGIDATRPDKAFYGGSSSKELLAVNRDGHPFDRGTEDRGPERFVNAPLMLEEEGPDPISVGLDNLFTRRSAPLESGEQSSVPEAVYPEMITAAGGADVIPAPRGGAARSPPAKGSSGPADRARPDGGRPALADAGTPQPPDAGVLASFDAGVAAPTAASGATPDAGTAPSANSGPVPMAAEVTRSRMHGALPGRSASLAIDMQRARATPFGASLLRALDQSSPMSLVFAGSGLTPSQDCSAFASASTRYGVDASIAICRPATNALQRFIDTIQVPGEPAKWLPRAGLEVAAWPHGDAVERVIVNLADAYFIVAPKRQLVGLEQLGGASIRRGLDNLFTFDSPELAGKRPFAIAEFDGLWILRAPHCRARRALVTFSAPGALFSIDAEWHYSSADRATAGAECLQEKLGFFGFVPQLKGDLVSLSRNLDVAVAEQLIALAGNELGLLPPADAERLARASRRFVPDAGAPVGDGVKPDAGAPNPLSSQQAPHVPARIADASADDASRDSAPIDAGGDAAVE
jgi:hypothetical protein